MEKKLKSFRLALIGLTILIASYLGTELINLYNFYDITFWISWGIYLPALILMVLGTIKLRSVRKELNLSFIFSVLALVCMVLGLMLVLKSYKAFGITSFIDIKAMFLKYIADLGILGFYFMSIKSFFQIMARSNVKRDFNGDLKKVKIYIFTIILTMIIVPFAHAWSGIIKIVLGIIFIGASTYLKIMLLKMLEGAHSKLYVVKVDE